MQSSKFKYICIMVVTALAIMCCYLIIYLVKQAYLGNPGNIVNSGFETTEKPDEEIDDMLPKDWIFTEGCVIEQGKSFEGDSCLKLPINSTIEMEPVEYSFTVAVHKVYKFGLKLLTDSVDGVKVNLYIGVQDDYRCEEIIPTQQGVWTDVSMLVKFEEVVKASIKIVITTGSQACYVDNVYIEEESPLTTDSGASIRFSEDSPGLRFTGKVDKVFYDYCVENYVNVSAGILIVPNDYVSDNEELTFKYLTDKGYKYIDITANKWNNAGTAHLDGYYGFNCAVIDILPQNTDRQFSARTFMRYTYNGVETFLYGNFDKEINSRSIYEVANSLLPYVDNYESYQKEIITHYATAVKQVATALDFVHEKESYVYTGTVGDGVVKISATQGTKITIEQNGEVLTLGKDFSCKVMAGEIKITVSVVDDVIIKHYLEYKKTEKDE